MNKFQKQEYNKLYKKREYVFDLPDYKITNSEQISGKRILVLGGGTARDVRYLAKKNDVYVVDFSEQALKVAKNSGVKTLKTDLNNRLGFKTHSFDIIVAKDIIEHIDNATGLLEEVRRLLKPSGYAVINVPNHFYLPLRLRVFLGKNLIWKTFGHDHTKLFEEWNYMHKFFFTWKGYKRFLKNTGLEIAKTFWDFGTLAHYNQPEIVFEYLKKTNTKKEIIFFLKSSWRIFNFLFPRSLRSKVVSLSPGLFCASFYVWVKPKTNN